MAEQNKMKIHNAEQSLRNIRGRSELLSEKMRAHIEAGGLYPVEFNSAVHHLAQAQMSLSLALGVLGDAKTSK